MKPAELFPKETIWRADGHASDLVICAVADGQVDVVPPLALAHVERCEHCGERLGEAALLTLGMDELAAEHWRAPAPVKARVPVFAAALALTLALAGTLLATGGIDNLSSAFTEFLRMALALLRAVVDVTPKMARALNSAAPLIMGVSGFLVVLMGWAVARLAPREALKGNVG